MSTKPRILWVGDSSTESAPTRGSLGEAFDLESAESLSAALTRVDESHWEGIFVSKQWLGSDLREPRLLRTEQLLDNLPEAVATLDSNRSIRWSNAAFKSLCHSQDVAGKDFYEALGSPQILGGDCCPIQEVVQSSKPRGCTLQTADNQYLHVHVAALETSGTATGTLVATLSDVTAEFQQQQKLAAIHEAGAKLTDLKPEEIFAMDVDQRIDLLKDNIRHYTRDLLNIEFLEIRLLEQATGNLFPLLSVGIDQEAADRKLYASTEDNGVTGYVAASGKSYLCTDTSTDPRYLSSFRGASSSITVPIWLHEQVIGTLNVESPRRAAFVPSDQQFLEIFARDIARALNTLELLVAQKTNAAQQSCEAIHRAVALPVDEILVDAVHVIEKYIGHDAEVVQRLQRILRNARDIKRSIQQVGQRMAPVEAVLAGYSSEQHAKPCGRRVLVVDDDAQVRHDAHDLLNRFGCVVETAIHGDEAVKMVRNSYPDAAYDVIISAVRLPDYSGHQLLLRLQPIMGHDTVPMVLMTGFGWDPGHSIVKARQAGLLKKAVLYKPFRLDQLINVVEMIIDTYQPAA